MNADTKVHLAHIQAFFYKLESLAGKNIILRQPYQLVSKTTAVFQC